MNARLGKGPIILLADASLIPHRKLRDYVLATAKEMGIPIQLTTMVGGGTDAGSIHLSETGVPSISFGIPTRYIHSHNSIFNIQDYLMLKELLVGLISRIDCDVVKEIRSF